jgi:hypothetical protein
MAMRVTPSLCKFRKLAGLKATLSGYLCCLDVVLIELDG